MTRERIMEENYKPTLWECCPEMNGQSHQNFIQIPNLYRDTDQISNHLGINSSQETRNLGYKTHLPLEFVAFLLRLTLQIDGAQTARHPENSSWPSTLKASQMTKSSMVNTGPTLNLMLLSFFSTQTDKNSRSTKETAMHKARADPQHWNTYREMVIPSDRPQL